MRFNKLRLSGFKSFVDGTELVIEPGLTGVVGPNGCGKSNLVEALRWVMGESSPKQMRGGEMDDVIFSGTRERPPRNIAEVVLSLDNTDRTAPARYNDDAELRVSRRIERGSGSTYRINGKEVRARDVQILFADAASGARSTAIVSQGRIGAVIAAKPTDRRAILEEAAGITGLHSRRHEAELRLRGAETNLGRLDDVLVTLDAQLNSLKKQARQANRYRNISDHIRRAEAALFHLRWSAAADETETGRARLAEADREVTELTRRAGAASTRQADAAADLPALRQAEAGAAAELQRLILARDGLDAEEERIAAARKDCELRLQQVAADTAREKALAKDAGVAMERLEAERAGIEEATDDDDEARRKAAEALEAASGAVDALEARLTEVTERMAAAEARRASLAGTISEVNERKERLAARAATVAEAHAELERRAVDPAALDTAKADFAAARAGLERTRADAQTAEAARTEAADKAADAVSALQAAQAAMTRLEAEERALAGVLETGDEEPWPPLIESLTVEPGFEAALAAALGEDLLAPADEPASAYWRSLAPFAKPPPLPEGAQPLNAVVKGPKALTRRLSQVGVVADDGHGARLGDRLSQGQRLVSRDGALWRWDGFTMSAGAATGGAARLKRRNRLVEVRGQLAAAGAT
ncbi:MAG: chromosome segregation SMC family protein, partial [Paracoccaceae bacterium]